MKVKELLDFLMTVPLESEIRFANDFEEYAVEKIVVTEDTVVLTNSMFDTNDKAQICDMRLYI